MCICTLTLFIHVVEPEPYYDIVYESLPAEREIKDEITAKVNGWFSQVAEKCNSKNVLHTMDILFDRDSTVETIVHYAKNMVQISLL